MAETSLFCRAQLEDATAVSGDRTGDGAAVPVAKLEK